MTRSRRTILLTILLLIIGGIGLWFLGPVKWQEALDRAERRSPRDEGDREEKEARTPSLIGRPSEPPPAVVPATETSGDLAVRFVVAGTTTPIPLVEWTVRGGIDATGWKPPLFEGRADRSGRAVIPAEAVVAWRDHEIFLRRIRFVGTTLDQPPSAAGNFVTIPIVPRTKDGWALRRYAGVVVDGRRAGIPGALLRFSADKRPWWARADEEGRFDVTFPTLVNREELRLIAVAPGYDCAQVMLPTSGAVDFEVTLEEDLESATVVLHVVTPTGVSAPGAWLRVEAAEPGNPWIPGRWSARAALAPWYPAEGKADAEGRFVIHGIEEGTMRVRAHLGHLVAVTSFEIRRPETVAEVRLQRGDTLTGEVVVACDGRCGPEEHRLDIRVRSLDRHGVYWTPLDRGGLSPGPFVLEGVPPERLVIQIHVPGHARVVRTIDVVRRVSPITLGRIEIGE